MASPFSNRGYFGIGIVGSKTPANVGTLWRSAGNFGAAFIFTIGRRYPAQASDTIKSWKHLPLFEVDALNELPTPKECIVVGVEQAPEASPLPRFSHPERALYLLGAEDRGLPPSLLARCDRTIQIATPQSLNVAVAGSIVMYDRQAKEGAVPDAPDQ